MHTYLIPVDGSKSATHAVEYATRLAREYGSITLHLVTVHPEPVSYGEIQVYVTQERLAELQKIHSEEILKPAMELVRAAGVPHQGEVLTGEVGAAIVKRAGELACDGIIMGTRGMSAIGNLVMGSVATDVVHRAIMPVTLVK